MAALQKSSPWSAANTSVVWQSLRVPWELCRPEAARLGPVLLPGCCHSLQVYPVFLTPPLPYTPLTLPLRTHNLQLCQIQSFLTSANGSQYNLK